MTTACRDDCVSAVAAASHAARRREPEKPSRRCRSPACRRPCAVCRRSPCRPRRIALVGGRAGSARGLHPLRGRAQLFLARADAASADRGGALAHADRHPHLAVAVQAQRADDDRDFRRRDGHRFRHFSVLDPGQSRFGLDTGARGRCGDSGVGAPVAHRAVPGAPQSCLTRVTALPRRAWRAVVCDTHGPGGRVLPASICVQIRAIERPCRHRSGDRQRAGGRRRDRGPPAAGDRRSLPHIVMVFDESSFDATMLPGAKVPPDYREHFRSSDGKTRAFVVEGAGGPSWYTEYNVLTGLSVRSYGRFSESVTRLAAGHVKRGLPHALRKCGYSTYSLYSWFGAFVGARRFQTATGVEHFLDAKELRTGPADTDIFFYDHAVRVIAQDRDRGPVFVFVYLAVNHFPWDYRYRPDLLPDWVNPGNPFEIDEYLRRQ